MMGLGIDAGGSATRWVLHADGNIVASGALPGASGHLYVPAEHARFVAMTAALREQLSAHGPVRGVIAGITGLSGTADEAPAAAKMVAEAAGVPATRVRIENDLWIAYHAAFAPGAGFVVYAGTGSAGAHIRADGSELRVGGRGMLIDDGGSAFWIGREAVNIVYRALDADPKASSILARAVFAAIGTEDWDGVRAYIYGGGRDSVAQLARAVAAAAADGDVEALALLGRAGAELARLALALARREGALPVALLGRAAGLHPIILDSMRAAASALNITRVEMDAAATAARLAAAAA